MRVVVVAIVAGMLAVAGCGGDEVAEGPPVVDGHVLGDSLALAAKAALEDAGVFGTSVGEQGGRCRGRGARWACTLQIVVTSTGTVRDRRTYAMRVKEDGCWTARQTGTDVGETGEPNRPGNPGVLRGCVE